MASMSRLPGDHSLDFTTPQGAALRRRLEERLESLRLQNDDPSRDAVRTAELRGRIAEIKALLEGAMPIVKASGY